MWLLFVLGRLKECIEAGERALTRLGGPELAGMNWAGVAENLAAAHAMAGNLDRAEDLMRTVLGTGELFMRIVVACDLVALLGTRDRVAEAEQLLNNILEHRCPDQGTPATGSASPARWSPPRRRSTHPRGLRDARDLLQPVLGDRHLTTDSEYLWPVVLDAARLFNNPPALEPLGERTRWAAVVQALPSGCTSTGRLAGVVRRRHRPPGPCAEPGHSRSMGPGRERLGDDRRPDRSRTRPVAIGGATGSGQPTRRRHRHGVWRTRDRSTDGSSCPRRPHPCGVAQAPAATPGRRAGRQRHLRADHARARGPHPARRGAHQPPDRRRTVHLPEDRERPRLTHHQQAGRRQHGPRQRPTPTATGSPHRKISSTAISE